jgi:hypothetical protein
VVDITKPNTQNVDTLMFAQSHETYESFTTQAGGYHGANNVYSMAPTAQSESFYAETADAFVNLSMVATADKDLLSTLTSTNANLTVRS